jgi:hypothetical protein
MSARLAGIAPDRVIAAGERLDVAIDGWHLAIPWTAQ